MIELSRRGCVSLSQSRVRSNYTSLIVTRSFSSFVFVLSRKKQTRTFLCTYTYHTHTRESPSYTHHPFQPSIHSTIVNRPFKTTTGEQQFLLLTLKLPPLPTSNKFPPARPPPPPPPPLPPLTIIANWSCGFSTLLFLTVSFFLCLLFSIFYCSSCFFFYLSLSPSFYNQ